MEYKVIEHNGAIVVEAIPDGASIFAGNNVLDAIVACGERSSPQVDQDID